jgi:hypothetical protein
MKKWILLTIFLLGFQMLFSCNQKAKYELQCRNEMQQITIALYSMWSSGVNFDEDNISRKIIEFNKDNKNGVFNPKYKRISDNIILDPQGHGYCIKFKKEVGEVEIWSVGLNGVDEHGCGDDISIVEKISDSQQASNEDK